VHVRRHHLAAIDARTGSPLDWNPGTDGVVYAMAASPSGDRLYVGGDFSKVHGSVRHDVAAFVPAGKLLPLAAQVSGGPVRALAASSSTLYLGGGFTSVDGGARRGLAALRRKHGALRGWYPGAAAGGSVHALALAGRSRLIVGGEFDAIGTTASPNLAAVDPSSGAVLGWASHPDRPVRTLLRRGRSVYAGTKDNRANRYATSTGVLRFSVHGDGDVQTLAALQGVLYIGGHFRQFDGHSAIHLAAVDASSGAWMDWGAEANSVLGAFAACTTKDALFIGGDFTRVSGTHQERLAMFPT
jgi:hypothetical protein